MLPINITSLLFDQEALSVTGTCRGIINGCEFKNHTATIESVFSIFYTATDKSELKGEEFSSHQTFVGIDAQVDDGKVKNRRNEILLYFSLIIAIFCRIFNEQKNIILYLRCEILTIY